MNRWKMDNWNFPEYDKGAQEYFRKCGYPHKVYCPWKIKIGRRRRKSVMLNNFSWWILAKVEAVDVGWYARVILARINRGKLDGSDATIARWSPLGFDLHHLQDWRSSQEWPTSSSRSFDDISKDFPNTSKPPSQITGEFQNHLPWNSEAPSLSSFSVYFLKDNFF